MALTIATYNVKDLFDSVGGPAETALNRKLAVLAGVIRKLDADVLALQEVGSESVVDRLRTLLPDSGYTMRIVGTTDKRGIACALLARVPVRRWEIHTAEQLDFPRFHEADPAPFGSRIPLRRGIVHAEIDAGTLGVVHALVLHFKSVRPLPLVTANGPIEPQTSRERAEAELRTLVWRGSEALFVRGLVDGICARDPSHHVAVMGDFNDVPGSVTLRVVRGYGETALRSAAEDLPAEDRYSVVHSGTRYEIDHVLLSAGLHSKMTQARFFHEGLRDHAAIPETELPTPDSDHAPLVVQFR